MTDTRTTTWQRRTAEKEGGTTGEAPEEHSDTAETPKQEAKNNTSEEDEPIT